MRPIRIIILILAASVSTAGALNLVHPASSGSMAVFFALMAIWNMVDGD